jgi:hypothetical protein
VTNHERCIVQSYVQWLQDSDYSPVCLLCKNLLADEPTVRLVCYDVFHWSCLDKYASELPATTAPAGYQCPKCKVCVFPPSNLVSPLADILKTKLATTSWAQVGLLADTAASIDAAPQHQDEPSAPPPSQPMNSSMIPAHLKANNSINNLSSGAASTDDESNGFIIVSQKQKQNKQQQQQTATNNTSIVTNNRQQQQQQHMQLSPDLIRAYNLDSNPLPAFQHHDQQQYYNQSAPTFVNRGQLQQQTNDILISSNHNQSYDTNLGMVLNMPKNHMDPDSDEQKYQRRPLLDWLNRWLMSRQLKGKNNPFTRMTRQKRILFFILICILAFLTLIITFSRLASLTDDDSDPAFDPLNNPNIRVEAEPNKN